MITTSTRGVGINRNIGLLLAEGDIVLFGDDDMEYEQDVFQIARNAFDEIPEADIIIFNLKYKDVKGSANKRRTNSRVKKIGRLSYQNYGAPRIAIRLSSQRAANIWFSTLFGGGAKYNAGEDVLFLQSALKARLNIFSFPCTIATTDLSNSSWNRGYNKKFFFDKGALFAALSSRLFSLLIVQYAVRHSEIYSEIGLTEALRLMFEGARAFKAGAVYSDVYFDAKN